MSGAFHLSLDVRSLSESVAFYTRVLDAVVVHRDPSGYVNLDVCGCQLTLKESAAAAPHEGIHLGVNLDLDAFDALAKNLLTENDMKAVMPPRVVDAGTPLERKKMYLRCPTGYLIEIKGQRRAGKPVHRQETA